MEGTSNESWWLRETLAFSVPSAKYMDLFKRKKWDGKKRFFDYKTQTFPIGLLPYVMRAGTDRSIQVVDKRVFSTINMSPLTLNTIDIYAPERAYQLKTIEMCLEHKNCLIEAATNAGKTAIFSGLVKKVHPAPTLILTHSKLLLDQIVGFIEQYTGFECGFITASDIKIRPVTVAMIKTLKNRLTVEQEVAVFFESLQCVIHDEVHHSQAKQFSTILEACQAPYRWGFSGTVPPEKDFNGVLVRQYFGPVVFKISNDELIELKISAKPKIHVYEMAVDVNMRAAYAQARTDTDDLRAKNEVEEKAGRQKKKPDTYYDHYFIKRAFDIVIDRGVVNNPERNEKVLEILQKNPQKSTLVVVDYIAHGALIEKMLLESNVDVRFISGDSVHPSGVAEHREQALTDFKAGKLQVLVSTSIVDEGLDISRIEVLVLLAGKKSRRQLLQRIGRSLRRKEGENAVAIYDFCDLGNKHLLKHSRERLAIYKAEKFEVEFV